MADADLKRAEEIRGKRAATIEDMKRILGPAQKEKRDLTAEETENWRKLHADQEAMLKQAELLEKQDAAERSLAASIIPERKTPPADDARHTAFTAYLRGGVQALSPDQRNVLSFRATQAGAGVVVPALGGEAEQRALAVGTNSLGGYTVPEDFYKNLQEAMLQFGGMRKCRSTILRTESGADMPIPTSDDTSNSGAILSENTDAAEQDVTFGSVTLGSYMYTSKAVKVSYQMLQDSAINLPEFLGRKLGERLGRITNAHFTTGTGSSQPQGVVTGATSGVTSAAATSITYNELLALKHSVDPAYRENAEWMFNDSTLLLIKELSIGTTDARPLWQPSTVVGEPDRIDGDTYVINQSVADVAASAKAVLYGDFSAYFIRDVRDITLLRLDERFATALQVGFLAFSRHDGAVVDAGTHPIKFITQHA